MKKILKIITVLLICISMSFSISACNKNKDSNKNSNSRESVKNTATADNKEVVQSALQFVDMLNKGEYNSVFSAFNDTMKAAISEDKLKETWEQTVSQLGGFKKVLGTRTGESQGYKQVFIMTEFGLGKFDVLFTFDQDKKVAGFFITPTPTNAVPEEETLVSGDMFEETEVFIGSDELKLPGTLTIPRDQTKKVPAVILVHGSGPNDRDETLYNNKPFRDLAHGLASRNIAVLRYDKRTLVYPDKLPEGKLTFQFEVIDDVLAAVDLLKQTDIIDNNRIFVLGHSMGANLLPEIGNQADDVAGYIAMAGNVTPVYELIPYQYEYIFSLDGEITDEEQKTLNDAKSQAETIKSGALKEGMNVMNAPAEYWDAFKNYDPIKTAMDVDEPFMFLQGERDYQVPVSEFEKWKSGLLQKKNAEFKLYPKLNHLFMVGTGEGKSTPQEYTIEQHIPEQVIEDIADWISGVL